ncbi:HNH endonuclease signature motif containing protein [Isoptericola hypogeus]
MFDDGAGRGDDGAEGVPESFAPAPFPRAALPGSGRVPDGGRTGGELGPGDVARLVDPGPAPTVLDVSAAIDDVVAIQERIDALEGRKLLAVERARRAAARCEAALLDDSDPELRRASAVRRHDLAERAFTADLGTALRLSEEQASLLVDTARTLTEASDLAVELCGAAEHPGADEGSRPVTSTLVELCRGGFSAAHARAIADVLADLPGRCDDGGEARARVQAAVLPAAAEATLTQLRKRLRRARDLAHPRPVAERHRAAAEKRAVYVDPGKDGMAWLTAHVPAAFAHAIHDRLTRAARELKRAGGVTGGGLGNVSGRAIGDWRTLDQLRADTFVALLIAGVDGAGIAGVDRSGSAGKAAGVAGLDRPGATGKAARAAGATGLDGQGATEGVAGESGAGVLGPMPGLAELARRITPTVHVTVPVSALLGGDAPADLDGYGPVDADTAARLTANARSLRRLLVDPVDGRVLATDPGTYTVPAALRTLLRARDRVCRFPGCTRKAAACDVDHVTAWADGGRTTADNLAHLCRRHHVMKHQTRWRVVRHDGTLTWTSPTGRVHHDRVAVDDLHAGDPTAGDRALRDPGPPSLGRPSLGPARAGLSKPEDRERSDLEPPGMGTPDVEPPDPGPPPF